MKQEIMGWQWHQLDHMQIICTSPHPVIFCLIKIRMVLTFWYQLTQVVLEKRSLNGYRTMPKYNTQSLQYVMNKLKASCTEELPCQSRAVRPSAVNWQLGHVILSPDFSFDFSSAQHRETQSFHGRYTSQPLLADILS